MSSPISKTKICSSVVWRQHLRARSLSSAVSCTLAADEMERVDQVIWQVLSYFSSLPRLLRSLSSLPSLEHASLRRTQAARTLSDTEAASHPRCKNWSYSRKG